MAKICKLLGYFILAIVGLWGIYVSFIYLSYTLGIANALVAILFSPFAVVFLPWYGLFVHGDWTMLLIIYGGGLLAGFFLYLSEKLERLEKLEKQSKPLDKLNPQKNRASKMAAFTKAEWLEATNAMYSKQHYESGGEYWGPAWVPPPYEEVKNDPNALKKLRMMAGLDKT